MFTARTFVVGCVVSGWVLAAQAQTPPEGVPDAIEAITIHRVFKQPFACSEHYAGELPFPGDDLGSDCTVHGGMGGSQDAWFTKEYRTDGRRNEDWYGWGVEVLAPFDGKVVDVRINPVVNEPGRFNPKPASGIVIERADGTRVLLAHVADISVKVGDRVRAGQPVAKVGNNGYSRKPHVHLGAWRGETPLQIRFDLRSR